MAVMKNYGATTPSLPLWSTLRQERTLDGNTRWRRVKQATCLAIGVYILHVLAQQALWPATTRNVTTTTPGLPLEPIPSRLESFQECSIAKLRATTNLTFMDSAHPLELLEFAERRERLAQALKEDAVDAFVVEPGYGFRYYGNV
jgi:hypothetical protein